LCETHYQECLDEQAKHKKTEYKSTILHVIEVKYGRDR
jgi:hypothetical protein